MCNKFCSIWHIKCFCFSHLFRHVPFHKKLLIRSPQKLVYSLQTFLLHDPQRIVSLLFLVPLTLLPSNTHRLGYQATALEQAERPGSGCHVPTAVNTIKRQRKNGNSKKRIGFGEGNFWKSWLALESSNHWSSYPTMCSKLKLCKIATSVTEQITPTQCRWQIASRYSLIAAFWIFTSIFHRCYICQHVFIDTRLTLWV